MEEHQGDKGLCKPLIILLRQVRIKQKLLASWFDLTSRQVRNIEKEFIKEGSKVFALKPKPGRDRKTTPQSIGWIISIVKELSQEGVELTASQVRQRLLDRHGLKLSETSIRNILSEYGLRSIFPLDSKSQGGDKDLIYTSFGGGWLLIPYLLPLGGKLFFPGQVGL